MIPISQTVLVLKPSQRGWHYHEGVRGFIKRSDCPFTKMLIIRQGLGWDPLWKRVRVDDPA